MSAVDFINYCVDGFYQLEYSDRLIFIFAFIFVIILHILVFKLTKLATIKIFKFFKNRGKDNA